MILTTYFSSNFIRYLCTNFVFKNGSRRLDAVRPTNTFVSRSTMYYLHVAMKCGAYWLFACHGSNLKIFAVMMTLPKMNLFSNVVVLLLLKYGHLQKWLGHSLLLLLKVDLNKNTLLYVVRKLPFIFSFLLRVFTMYLVLVRTLYVICYTYAISKRSRVIVLTSSVV